MQLALENINSEGGTILEKATKSFFAVENAMEKLRQFIYGHTFTDCKEEIEFFKIEKPRFHNELIYWGEIIRLETDRPKGSRKVQMEFYQRDEIAIKQLLSRNHILLIYTRMNQHYYDHILFIRNAELVALRPEVQIDLDKKFATQAGSQLAEIQALERTLIYIDQRMSKLKKKQFYVEDSELPISKLKWTCSKADFAECMYFLYYLGAFNHGKTTLKEIFQWGEAFLGVKISNCYTYMMKMRIRKKERAQFLKRGIETLYRKMDESDEHPRFK